MARKVVVKKKTGIRRTRSMQEIIEQSKNLIDENLGKTRSLTFFSKIRASPLKLKKKIIKAPKTAIKKVTKTKVSPKIRGENKIGKLIEKEKKEKKISSEIKKSSKKKQIEEKADQEVQFVQKEPRRTQSVPTAGKAQNIVNLIGIVDVVFCMDTTGSMWEYLEQTKETIKTIVKNISEKSKGEDISVRFGVVCYRDHPPEEPTYVYKVQNLATDKEAIQFISKQDADGGGDDPEAVLDGLFAAATEITWRDARKVPSLRYIIHICDSPPHGKQFGIRSRWWNGVPSGITLDKVIHAINIREIHYRLINLDVSLKKMAELFEKNFTNYEETTLDKASQLNIKVSDMIIRELLPDYQYD